MDHHYEEQHLDATHHYDDILEPLLLAVIALILVLGLLTDFFSGSKETSPQQASTAASMPAARPNQA